MPTSKRSYSKKGSSAKRQKRDYSPRRKVYGGKPLASQTNMSLYQKGGQVEKKWNDTSGTLYTTGTATASVLLINGLTQGTTANTRVGSRIELKSVAFRANFQSGTSATGVTPLRIKIVYDKQSDGAAPAATDIMAGDSIDGHNNLANAGRFITLFDQTWQPVSGFGGGASGAGASQAQCLEGFVKCALPVKYNSGNAGTIADIVAGAVYVLAWTNGVTFGGGGLDATGHFRIRWTDI